MIQLTNLTKKFGSLIAVDNITMSVAQGEVLGFLGPNGAGKSTTMRMVAGFLPPTWGTAVVCGHDVTEDPIAVKRCIGYLPEGAPLYGEMTPWSLLEFVAEVRGYDGDERRRRVAEAVDKVALGEVLHQSIETLSKGFKRRVGLAQAILHDPDVLILDEPTDGLDPNQKREVRSLIRRMSHDKAIVISTHILEEVDAVCSRAAIVADGRLLADDSPDRLLARSPLRNSVVISIDAALAAEVRSNLESLGSADGVETVDEMDGAVRLRVLPKDGRPIVVEVGDLIRAKGFAVRELFVDKGGLDEVFREITAGSAEKGGRGA